MGIIKSFALFFLLGFILSMPSQTQATVLSYDEVNDGDIAGSGFTFNLDFGINTVRGTLGCSTPCDFDFFNITLPSGGLLGDITIAMEAGLDFSQLPVRFEYPGGNLFFTAATAMPFFTTITDAAPNGGGRIGFNSLFSGGGLTNYEITLAVALEVIPLPAALPLFLTGLAGLGLMRRRQRQRQQQV